MADSIQVIRKVWVRSIVNDKLRTILNEELGQNLSNLENEFKQFSTQREAYVQQCREKDVKPDFEILKKMAMEEERYKGQKAQLESRKQHVASLKDGEEFVHGTVDSPVNVAVGDNWHSFMTGVDVVLDDGIVKEIREREIDV